MFHHRLLGETANVKGVHDAWDGGWEGLRGIARTVAADVNGSLRVFSPATVLGKREEKKQKWLASMKCSLA